MSAPFSPLDQYSDNLSVGVPSTPEVVAARDPSNTIDIIYNSGTLWLSDLSQGGSGNLFVQSGNSAGLPSWTAVTAGSAGGVSTISDGGTQVFPIVGNIALIGTANQITVTASAPSHQLVFSLPASIIAPGSITTTTSMTVGTDLTVANSATISNDLIVTDDVTVGGDLNVAGAISLAGLTVAGTVQLNVTGNANTTIGNAASTGAILINVPIGNLQINGNAHQINIGNDAAANLITIGSVTGAAALTLQAGTGNMLLTGAVTTAITVGQVAQTGNLTFGLSTAGQNINIGSAANTAAQIISIGNGASAADSTVNILSGVGTLGAGTLALGNNTRVTTIGLGNIAPAAARTITIAGGNQAQNDTLNIMSGAASAGTQAVNIFSGNSAGATQSFSVFTGSGAGTINLGTGVTGVKSINIGGTAANVIRIGDTQTAGSIALSSAMVAGTFTVGGAAMTGAITLGASTAGQIVNISSAASNTGANVVNILNGATPGANTTLNIMNGAGTAGTQTVNILATGATRAGAVNIGTGVAAHVVTIGQVTSSLAVNAPTTMTLASGAATALTVTTAAGTGTAISATSSAATIPAILANVGSIKVTPTDIGAGASPLIANNRFFKATFSGVSIAANADQALVVTNSTITNASTDIMITWSGTTTGSAVSLKSVVPAAGSVTLTFTNGVGATTSTSNIVIVGWVLN